MGLVSKFRRDVDINFGIKHVNTRAFDEFQQFLEDKMDQNQQPVFLPCSYKSKSVMCYIRCVFCGYINISHMNALGVITDSHIHINMTFTLVLHHIHALPHTLSHMVLTTDIIGGASDHFTTEQWVCNG